jgi:N,N'-diacetyllegionaminate synthase
LGVPAFKVGSGDLNNLPFLKYIAQKGKAIILSTGMGTLGEIEEALDTIYKEGNRGVIVLHCISVYPPKPSDINLRAMDTIKRSFDVIVGYSDHTIGINIPLAAVARGAKVIEKHFTLDRTMPGPDQKVSTEPQEFKEMVEKSRMIERALGSGIKKPSPDEEETKKSFRRSIIAREKILKGEKINKDQIEFKRPGTGLPPKMADFVIGRTAKKDINKDQIIAENDI